MPNDFKFDFVVLKANQSGARQNVDYEEPLATACTLLSYSSRYAEDINKILLLLALSLV